MNLTNQQYAGAVRDLQSAGITGSDLETSLRGACALAGDTDYPHWLAHIKAQTPQEIINEYGHDFCRVVLALKVAT